MTLRLSEICRIIGAEPPNEDVDVTGIAVDSRTVAPGDLFCAIRGERQDGHDFVDAAIVAGAAASLVETTEEHRASDVVVEDIPAALALIGAHARSTFTGTVIGITGSVGKTTVKEVLASILAAFGPTLKSEGNLNTEFGVPMTWMNVDPRHQFAIIEMAMRGPGQIAHLYEISKPTIGVITEVGTAHIGELGSFEAILDAKVELISSLSQSKIAVIPGDRDYSDALRSATRAEVITYGEHSSDVLIDRVRNNIEAENVEWSLKIRGAGVRGTMRGLGRHLGRSVAAAMCVPLALKLDLNEAASAVAGAALPPGRLTIVQHGKGRVLADVYNSSPESCKEALRLLSEMPAPRHAIFGDMRELGDHSHGLHRSVGNAANDVDLATLATFGEEAKAIADGYGKATKALRTHEEGRAIVDSVRGGGTVLVKGSRSLEMERMLELAEVQT